MKLAVDSLARVDTAIQAASQKEELKSLVLKLDTRRKSKLKFIGLVRSYEDQRHISGAVKLAASIPSLSCDRRKFDKHPMLLNCPNGTLDLRTSVLRPHDPADMLTQLCPTEYHQEAKCPRWEQFMEEVFEGNKELIRWVQKLLGYCITGSVAEHIIPLFHGLTRNGKGTTCRAMHHILGDDYADVTPQHFSQLEEREAYHRAERLGRQEVRLRRRIGGRRTPQRGPDEAPVGRRQVQGPRHVQGLRRTHRADAQDRPLHQLQTASERGGLCHMGPARLVPFDVSFLGREEKNLDDTLKAEASGILRWLVDGCLAWQREGLGDTPKVTEATKDMRTENNHLVKFVKACCEPGDGYEAKVADLAAAYARWCYENKEEEKRKLTDTAFGKGLGALGYAIKENSGRKIRTGLRMAIETE